MSSISRRSGTWEPWATLAFGIVIAAVFVLIQIGTLFLYGAYESYRNPAVDMGALTGSLGRNGQFFSIVTCASAAVCSSLVFFSAWLRTGTTTREYLGLHRIQPRILLAWLTITPLLVFASDLVEPYLKHARGRDFTLGMYESAHFLPLLWIAMIIAAPVFEELFFRAFLLQGLRQSKIGTAGAVVVTALVWAIAHSQYSGSEILEVFIFGVVLGAARVRTRSVYPPIAMHALANLITMIQVAMAVGKT
ncbi:MAG: CPBP family intramembrane glutamic endopeptidase [Acidiferrobacterales bacterium]